HSLRDSLKGPFPVPTLDAFIRVGEAVSANLQDSPFAEVLEMLKAGTTFENLLSLGTLHFTPADNPALVDWLKVCNNSSTDMPNPLTCRVHPSEVGTITQS
ncbi:unnamed protein product, partial [Discosporangium mesarthrocarpum]